MTTSGYSTDLVLYYLYIKELADKPAQVRFLIENEGRELPKEQFLDNGFDAVLFDDIDEWYAGLSNKARVKTNYTSPTFKYKSFIDLHKKILAYEDDLPKIDYESILAEKDAEIKAVKAELEALVDKMATYDDYEALSHQNAMLESEITDLKLAEKEQGNFVQKIAKSKKFNSWFIAVFVVATGMFALTKLMSFLYPTDSPLIIVLTHIAFVIMAASIAISAVWFSYNQTDRKWVNYLVLAMFFLCEWVGASELFGFKTGVSFIDTALKYAVYSLYPPTMTLLLAHSSTTGGLQVAFSDAVSNLASVVKSEGLSDNIVTKFKKRFL